MHRLFSGSPEALAPLLHALSHIPRFGEASDEEGPAWLRPLYEGRAEPKISPFILASNIPPVPAKLVKKIQALEYVNMRNLLQDNIALAERLEALPRTASSSLQHSQREVDTILTWACAFLLFTAVMNEAHPDRTRGLLAYMRTIISEARRNECFAWRSYDSIFRRHAAANPDKDWTQLDHSLHATCLRGPLDPNSKQAKLCLLCEGADHTTANCALNSVQQPTKQIETPHTPMGSGKSPFTLTDRRSKICISWVYIYLS